MSASQAKICLRTGVRAGGRTLHRRSACGWGRGRDIFKIRAQFASAAGRMQLGSVPVLDGKRNGLA